MILKYGDMWSAWDKANLFLITTNACIELDYRLVMGAGIAKQARDRWPGIDMRIGTALRGRAERKTDFTYGGRSYTLLEPEYNLLISADWPRLRLGLFQVKRHFHIGASIGIITQSAAELALWCSTRPDAQVHLNFPGIGNGRLEKDAVLPIIEKLPDSVHVWQFKEEVE